MHGQTCNDRGTVWAYNSGDKSWNTSYVSDESIKADNLTKVGSHYLGEGSYPLKDGRTVYVGAEPDNPKNGDLLYAKDGNWRYDAKSEEWMRIPDGQVPPGGPTTGSGPDGRCLLIDGPNCKSGGPGPGTGPPTGGFPGGPGSGPGSGGGLDSLLRALAPALMQALAPKPPQAPAQQCSSDPNQFAQQQQQYQYQLQMYQYQMQMQQYNQQMQGLMGGNPYGVGYGSGYRIVTY